MIQDKLCYLPASICSNLSFLSFVCMEYYRINLYLQGMFNVFTRLRQCRKTLTHCTMKAQFILSIHGTENNIFCFIVCCYFLYQWIDFIHVPFFVCWWRVKTFFASPKIIKKFKALRLVAKQKSCWHEQRVKVFTKLLFLRWKFYCRSFGCETGRG